MKTYYEDGFVANKLGRRRRYPMSKNEAINFPIQSLGAEIVIDAMDRLSEIAVETKEWHLHPHLNIHDDLTFIIEDNDRLIDESIDFITREMLLLPYDFINVPMSVEVSIGPDWDDMEEVIKVNTIDIGRHKARKQK
jgi:DNA polymerase I-like protein with 3'-5' exonuclease and polymerase domains